MRIVLLFLSISLATLNCTTAKKMGGQSSALTATWIPIKQEIGGKELPAVAFKNQQLILRDSNYTVVAESVDKGVVKYSQTKMDIYGKEGVNTGKHFTAIYKIENEQLTICYNLAGTGYPEAFDTKGKSMYFLSVFKKDSMK